MKPKMPRQFSALLLITILAICCSNLGCDKSKGVVENPSPAKERLDQAASKPPRPLSSLAKTEAQRKEIEALEDLLDEAETHPPPEPAIRLPQLEGWTISEPRSLPQEDDGFSIAYDHQGLEDVTATIYQFSRGEKNIPDGVRGAGVKLEMQSAKDSIQQATEYGMWDSAEEVESKTVQLGDSKQESLWSRYKIRARGTRMNSEIYVWAKNNHYFKVRLTTLPRLSDRRKKVIAELLTGLGNAEEL